MRFFIDTTQDVYKRQYQDISMSGNRLPLQISHIYNSLYKSKNYFSVGSSKIETGLPKGWKLNVQQYLYSEGEGSEQKYVYIDQAGFRHNLYRYLKVDATPSGSSLSLIHISRTRRKALL